MESKEQNFKDKTIAIRGREEIKLSELSRDERDCYFAGHSDGSDESGMWAICAVVVFLLLIGVIDLIF